MRDVLERIEALRRPRILVQAARLGQEDYRRNTHLPRLLGTAGHNLPGPRAALAGLLEIEALLDAGRRAGAADYRASRHVSVLIALMGEARLLRACTRDHGAAGMSASDPGPGEASATAAVQTKASGIDSFLRAT